MPGVAPACPGSSVALQNHVSGSFRIVFLPPLSCLWVLKIPCQNAENISVHDVSTCVALALVGLWRPRGQVSLARTSDTVLSTCPSPSSLGEQHAGRPFVGPGDLHILSLGVGGLRAPQPLPVSRAPAWGVLVALRTVASALGECSLGL